jgi:hypothetical protein
MRLKQEWHLTKLTSSSEFGAITTERQKPTFSVLGIAVQFIKKEAMDTRLRSFREHENGVKQRELEQEEDRLTVPTASLS